MACCYRCYRDYCKANNGYGMKIKINQSINYKEFKITVFTIGNIKRYSVTEYLDNYFYGKCYHKPEIFKSKKEVIKFVERKCC